MTMTAAAKEVCLRTNDDARAYATTRVDGGRGSREKEEGEEAGDASSRALLRAAATAAVQRQGGAKFNVSGRTFKRCRDDRPSDKIIHGKWGR